MTSTIAAKYNLKLWQNDFVGTYLNSLTKEDIYMKQLEGFVKTGLEDHICKLVHTIYRTMQGAHDWYETLKKIYDKLGYTTSCADPCVHVSDTNVVMTAIILLWTRIQMTYSALRHQMIRLIEGRERWGRSGKSRMWERMSIFLECGFNRTLMEV